jgi:hypothetical protein
MTLLVLAICAGASAFIIWRVTADLRRGSIERGWMDVSRAADPPAFWGHITLSLLAAFACAGVAWSAWMAAPGDLEPSVVDAAMPAVLLIGFGAHWLSELRQGSAKIGTVSFARSDEAREYWLLVALKTVLLLAFAWRVFISLQ